MITNLPEGTWIGYRYRDQKEFGQLVCVDSMMCQQVGCLPPIGAIIHHGVWKQNDEFQVRKVYIYGIKN